MFFGRKWCIMRVAIIGLGLIGGSLALSLRKRGIACEIIGVDKSEKHLKKALKLDLIQRSETLESAVAAADVVILATPVDAIRELVLEILDRVDKQVVFDVGSTKSGILEAAAGHSKRGRFVACHPMAGTEFSGPEAAVPGLFEGKYCVICNADDSDPDAVQTASDIFEKIGMLLLFQAAEIHDMHAAYVSHVSHVSSIALALTVLNKEKSEEEIFRLASGGFRSTVRLAKSNPGTWVPIFRENREHLLDVLDEHITVLSRFRTALIKKDFDQIDEMMKRGNRIREILK